MKDIYGRDIGHTITLLDSARTRYTFQHPWPADTAVSAGMNGIVLRHGGGHCTTAFMEFYPGGWFIRGEGNTLAECEQQAWNQYQTALVCPSGKGHQWQARGHTNGGGWCAHCSIFRSDAFTGEQLNQFCLICSRPTTFWHDKTLGVSLCSEHNPIALVKDESWHTQADVTQAVRDVMGSPDPRAEWKKREKTR